MFVRLTLSMMTWLHAILEGSWAQRCLPDLSFNCNMKSMINERDKQHALEDSYQFPSFHDEDATHPILVIIIVLANLPMLVLKASKVHFAKNTVNNLSLLCESGESSALSQFYVT